MAHIVFMGTPAFGIPALHYLHAHHTVEAVITQPDKPSGRKKVLKASPIKDAALSMNLPVFQPEKIKDLYAYLTTIPIDFLITAAYGQIIPEKLLSLANVDALNLHGSILPKYRGAAPIQRAIMNGETDIGVSLMRMVKQMDAGPVYGIKKIPNTDYSSGEAFELLAELSVSLLDDYLEKIMHGLKPTPQDESKVTYAKKLSPGDELLTFELTAQDFINHARALMPSPLGKLQLKDISVKVVECSMQPANNSKYPVVKAIDKTGLTIALKGGDITLKRVQPIGKKPMAMRDFLNGKPKDFLVVGDTL